MKQKTNIPARPVRIDLRMLDTEHYTESLLNAASACGLYDNDAVSAIQGSLFSLLAARLEHYTDGKSCSVPVEAAQAVLTSLLYVLDFRLLAAPDAEGAAHLLQDCAAEVLYEEGLVLIRRRLRACELLYRRWKPQLEALPDSVLKTTAISGVGGFFRVYNPELFSDETHITADYPLYLGDDAVRCARGVTFLSRYLQGMADEAAFLSRFRRETLEAVFAAADRQYHDVPMNLFVPMYATVIGMVLLQRPFSAWKWGLRTADLDALTAMYRAGAFTEAAVRGAAESVIDLLMLRGSCAAYLRAAAGKFCASASFHMERHLTAHIFPDTERREDRTVQYSGGRLSADAFRCLVYDLGECASAADKAALVLSRVSGMEDVLDLLSTDDGTLDTEDRRAVLGALPGEALLWLRETLGEGALLSGADAEICHIAEELLASAEMT